MQAIEAALSQDLDHVVGWLNQNYPMLNHSKTKVMLMVVADVGEGKVPGGPNPPPLFWVKKEEMIEGKNASRASEVNTAAPPPPPPPP